MRRLLPDGRAGHLAGRMAGVARRGARRVLLDARARSSRGAPVPEAEPEPEPDLAPAVTTAYARATGPGSSWHAPAQWAPGSRRRDADAVLSAALRSQRHGGPDARRAARDRRRSLLGSDDVQVDRLAVALEAETAAVVAAGGFGGSPRPAARRSRPAVVVDVRCLQAGEYDTRGVGKHATSLLRSLVATAAADHRRPEVVGLVDPEAGPLSPSAEALLDLTTAHAVDVGTADVLAFVQLSPMTADSAVVAPFLAAPWVRTVAAVYDLVPYRAPWRYFADELSRTVYEARLLALHGYDRLLPISQSTASDLVALGGLPPARMRVSGVADPLGDPGPAADGAQAVDGSDPGRRYALAPTGADARKDLPAAVAGYALARARGAGLDRLVVVGRLSEAQRGQVRDLAADLGTDPGELDFRSGLSDADLAVLCAGASVVVVTSLAEGFSLPVAEAVRRGTPVVASDIPPHRELLGDGAWLAARRDPVGVAEALLAVLTAPAAVLAAQQGALGDLARPAAVDTRVREELAALLAGAADPVRAGDDEPPGSGPGTGDGRRRKVVVVTPWRPQVSGISDFSAATVAAMAGLADVTVRSEAEDPVPGPVPVLDLTVEPYLDPTVDTVLSVLGNSLLHLSILELVRRFGGPVLAHDSRMFEIHLASRGWEATSALVSPPGRPMDAEQFHRTLVEPDLLPRLGFDQVSRHARPLLVHSAPLADRLADEGPARPVVLPFVPHIVPEGEVDEARVVAAREQLRLGDELVVASFGLVDVRTKGADVLVEAVHRCGSLGADPVLHVVGPVAEPERRELTAVARRLGARRDPVFHGHVSRAELHTWLLAADVGVQLRRLRLGVSGALGDCIAHGLPTLATEGIAEQLDAPSYVVRVPHEATATQLAERLLPELRPRAARAAEVEPLRRAYLERRTMGAYARQLLAALEEGPGTMTRVRLDDTRVDQPEPDAAVPATRRTEPPRHD